MAIICDMGRSKGKGKAFTPEIIAHIFDAIADGGGEYKVIKDLKMGWSTWCEFKVQEHGSDALDPFFPDKYARAKESGFLVWEYKLTEKARDESRDLQPDGKGGFKSDNTAVNRDRLIIDTDKWIMSKRLNKVYGDKFQTDISSNGQPITPIFNVTIGTAEKKPENK